MNRERKAFTLLELLIVMVIIGILAIIAIPQYLGAVQSAKESAAITELKEFREMVIMMNSVDSDPTDGEQLTSQLGTTAGHQLWVDINRDGKYEKSLTLVNTLNCDTGYERGTGNCSVTVGNRTISIDMASGKINEWSVQNSGN